MPLRRGQTPEPPDAAEGRQMFLGIASFVLSAVLGWGLLWALFEIPSSLFTSVRERFDAAPVLAQFIAAVVLATAVIALVLSPAFLGPLFRRALVLGTGRRSLRVVQLRFAVGLAVSILGILLLVGSLPANGLAVRGEDCRPEGIMAALKAKIQGERFWKQQLAHLDDRLVWLASEPERHAKAEEDLERILAETDDFLEEMYEKHPQLRPSSSGIAADRLREEADAIESADLEAQMEVWLDETRLDQMRRLAACRPIVEGRAR